MSHSSTVLVPGAGARRALALLAMLGLVLTTLNFAAPVSAGGITAGFKGHTYGPGTGVQSPSQDKPQSKVWFADGYWWAGLFNTASDAYRIHRYNPSTHTWTNVGPTIDPRNDSHGDYLWDGATNSLYVASADGDSKVEPIRVYKLNYNPSTDAYTHDSSFTSSGVIAGTGPTETVTIAKDSTGQLWVTYQNPIALTTDREIMVNRSTTAEHLWGTAFSLGTADDDDVSAIIAYGGSSVGVMWTDQRQGGTQTFFRFRSHSDSAGDLEWSATANAAAGSLDFAEDHVNLKLTSTGSGEILAAVKTDGASTPHIQLIKRASNGTWSIHPVVDNAGAATRPQVVVDDTNDLAYVLYTAPVLAADGDQAIYYKSAPLGSLNFTTSGLGTALISDAPNDINDVSTPRHPVTSGMANGFPAIASSDTNFSYYHGWIDVPGVPFSDIDGNPFYDDIVWLYNSGITSGCTATLFCPKGVVTREQMASFLVRFLGLPPTSDDFFTDDESSIHEGDINSLAKAGVTTGCTATTFCPKGSVTREEMASFLARALDLPGTSEDFFTDDETSIHEANINRLAASGITTGCTATTYCPKATVKREQMAAFLHRADMLP